MLLNHSKLPLEGYPHPRWGVQGIQYTVYSIQYTLPWGPVPPQGGCTYTIYSVEYTSPWVPSPAEEYAVYSIQYIRQGGSTQYTVHSPIGASISVGPLLSIQQQQQDFCTLSISLSQLDLRASGWVRIAVLLQGFALLSSISV